MASRKDSIEKLNNSALTDENLALLTKAILSAKDPNKATQLLKGKVVRLAIGIPATVTL